MSKERQIKQYANLWVRVGGNVQPGELVIITADVRAARFARYVQTAAYRAGAGEVHIVYEDEQAQQEWYQRSLPETFETYPDWQVQRFAQWDAQGAVYLHLSLGASNLPAEVNLINRDTYRKAKATATQAHYSRTGSYQNRWSILALPNLDWARQVFPNTHDKVALARLWKQVLIATRADGRDPIVTWEAHNQALLNRRQRLNDSQLVSLHFSNDLGTALTVGLPKNHVWIGGPVKSAEGDIDFCPNIPTEELFTAPHRDQVHGRIVATKPLVYLGQVIEGMVLHLTAGVITDWTATTGQEALGKLITTDAGSNRLGEVALVPQSSPLARLNTLFYHTLFDENTCCHLAFGRAYATNLEGGATMTRQALETHGLNNSSIAVNFVFGSDDMSVTGTLASGEQLPLMEDGDFCF